MVKEKLTELDGESFFRARELLELTTWRVKADSVDPCKLPRRLTVTGIWWKKMSLASHTTFQ